MLRTTIEDGQGNSHKLLVDKEGGINVAVHQYPPLSDEIVAIPYRSYVTDSSGSSDMTVDGSVNYVDFCVTAIEDYDLYIKTLAIEITGAGGTLNEFGNIAALANGVQFLWTTQEQGDYEIHEGITTNYEFVRMCATEPYGGSGNAWKANNVSGGAEGFTPIFDTQKIFGIPWGMRLKKGTKDKLTFRVRDDLTTVTSLNIIAYGTRI